MIDKLRQQWARTAAWAAAALTAAALYGTAVASVAQHDAPSSASLVTASTATSPPTSLVSLLRQPLVATAYGPRPNGSLVDNGAAGSNIVHDRDGSGALHIDEQRIVGDYVTASLLHAQPRYAQRGWVAARWGFGRQNADGSFGGADAVHGSTMFIEAVLRALLIELESNQTSAGADLLPSAMRGVRSLARRNPDTDPELQRSVPLTHRFWIKAALMEQASQLSGEVSLSAIATDYANRAIAQQTADGIYPERGGYDVGYQATGIVYATRYWIYCDDAAQRARVAASVARGLRWLGQRVDADGRVDSSGSRRIGVERTWTGRIKGMPYGLVAEAFAAGAAITGDRVNADIAARIEASPAFIAYYQPRPAAQAPAPQPTLEMIPR